MPSAAQFDFDMSEEKARERRIAERRERVQERLRQQQLHRERQAGGGAPPPPAEPPLGKGKAAAAASATAVRAAHESAAAEVEAVRAGAEARTDAHREACDAEEAALREQVAAEAEASRKENRAIDLEWERLQAIKVPQELAAGIAAAAERCRGVLASKDGALGAARALLAKRDDQYVRLLRAQGEETDSLIAAMHAQHARAKAEQEAQLEAVEAAYLQERAELAAAQKAELDALLERRSALEQEFMEQYLAACEQCEEELEKLRAEGAREHSTLRRKLEGEVAALEAHLEGVKAAYGLNADKLDYNHRVLVEREKESKEALMTQKRRITRQWEVLNRLKKRFAAADSRCAAENARLSDEYQAVTRAFNHLQSKFRHFKAADLARFDKVRAMKEGELEALLGDLLEAEHLIAAFAAGLHPAADAGGAPASSRPASAACSIDGSGCQGLEVVGTAVAVDPLAAAREAAVHGPGEAPGEVVAAPAGEAGELIPAFRPTGVEADAPPADSSAGTAAAAESERRRSADGMDALARAELSASADSGALSLLAGEASTASQRSQKLQQLVARIPTAGDGRLTAEAVARSLGLRHGATVATLGLLFEGSERLELTGAAGAAQGLAQAVGSHEEAGQEDAAEQAGGPEPAYSLEQVERGLARLLQLLAPSTGTSDQLPVKAGRSQAPAGSAAAAAATAHQPTSKRYWQARADAALPPAVARSWQLLEKQAGQHFATLQARASAADEVLALQRENEGLKGRLAELLNSPLNKELQLPPTLLLR